MKAMNKVMLVLVVVMISVMQVKAQGLAEMPSTSFRSTSSSMVSSGSVYQSAAVSGYVSAEEYYSSNVSHRSNVRKATFEEGDDDDERPGHDDDPYSPIGEGLWVLMVMAVGFAGVRGWRCWRHRVGCAE